MAHEPDAADELNALEKALAGLKPRGDRLDRERLMFLAGQAAQAATVDVVSRGSGTAGRGWPAAFAAMTAIAASLLVALLVRPPHVSEPFGQQAIARPEHARAERPPRPAGPSSAADGYLRVRDLVCSRGLAAWPLPATASAGAQRATAPLRPSSLGALLDEFGERPGAHRAASPAAVPESAVHPGDKS